MRQIYFLTLLTLLGCIDKKKGMDSPELHLSKVEVGLNMLIDSYKVEYQAAGTNMLKDSTTTKYNLKIFNYLSTNTIDSINVHVDTVITNDLTVTTKFHNKANVAFQYGLTFAKPMTKYFDSLCNFMTGLKAGTDTTISFSYMGSHQLGDPSDTLSPALTIFAIPSFLKKPN
jgi:hypothetical protein